MKNLVFVLLTCLAIPAFGQTCEQKLARARESKAAGNYRLAIKQFQAAKGDCGELYSSAIEKAVIGIFEEIDSIKEVALLDRKRAIVALKFAYDQRNIAEQNEKEARRQRAIADSALASIKILLDTVQQLIQKGRELQNTFADSSTQYLFNTGLEHFKYDTVKQTRDYRNALTYFALSRFLKPNNNNLVYLIKASQKGTIAERAFHDGYLDKAKLYFDSILLLLDTIGFESRFEKLRLAQIEEVGKLYRNFKTKTRPASEALELRGNWWTLPQDFVQYKDVKSIVFLDNLSNFEQLPGVLGHFKALNHLKFEHCINVRQLYSWEQTPNLLTLTLTHNLNLFSVKNLDSLAHLQQLHILNCPALTYVEGTSQLQSFSTEHCPQLRVSKLLHDNSGLVSLHLADLPDDTIRIDNLVDLENLRLSRLKTQKLDGLDRNVKLKQLEIAQLSSLSYFVPPSQLKTIKVNDCDGLTDISRWTASDELNVLLLNDNNGLRQMPNWQQYPNLHTLLIQNDNEVKRIYGTKSLKNIKKLYVLNNPNIVTNSIHFGFGVEWGINLTSIKLEYEHRRRIPFANGRPDIGFKAVALYARKTFDYHTINVNPSAEGYIAGAVVTYYSPYWVYTGAGAGFSHVNNWENNLEPVESTRFVWINNLGAQFAPYFLKKDKMSINMDLYTIFLEKDYYILPSFGLTYYHTLGMNSNARFIRPGDARRHVWVNGKKTKISEVSGQF